jgi:hypothetical protein
VAVTLKPAILLGIAAIAIAACSSAHDGSTATPALVATAPVPSVGVPGAIAPLAWRPLYTEHLDRLTSGTDLGSSFVRDGKVVFLFGDTLSNVPALKDVDTVATAPLAMTAVGVPALTSTGRLAIGGVDLGAFNVPVEGVAAGDTTYLFFSTRYDSATRTYGRSTLAHATGLDFAAPLAVDHDVPSTRFLNVSVVVEDGDAYVFASGRYRDSYVYVARVPRAKLADRSAWRYRDASGSFVAGEDHAAPVVDGPRCVGELSVRKHPSVDAYLMTYNCESPRGVYLHIARRPDGPWTPATRIFDPAEGYGRFMHAKESAVGHDDGLAAAGTEEVWGGEYGPYLVPSWFTREQDAFGIVYALSSWNPYQVHLMRTWLAAPGVDRPRTARGAGLSKSKIVNGDFATGDLTGWKTSGDAPAVFVGADGLRRVTTSTPGKGDVAVGTLAQSFVVDETTSELTFSVHGGDGRVTLRRGGDVVRTSRGRRVNHVDTPVVWNIEEYRGETLTVVIEDTLTGPWGFIGARSFATR